MREFALSTRSVPTIELIRKSFFKWLTITTKLLGNSGPNVGQSERGRARGARARAHAHPDGASHAMKDIIKGNGDVRRK